MLELNLDKVVSPVKVSGMDDFELADAIITCQEDVHDSLEAVINALIVQEFKKQNGFETVRDLFGEETLSVIENLSTEDIKSMLQSAAKSIGDNLKNKVYADLLLKVDSTLNKIEGLERITRQSITLSFKCLGAENLDDSTYTFKQSMNIIATLLSKAKLISELIGSTSKRGIVEKEKIKTLTDDLREVSTIGVISSCSVSETKKIFKYYKQMYDKFIKPTNATLLTNSNNLTNRLDEVTVNNTIKDYNYARNQIDVLRLYRILNGRFYASLVSLAAAAESTCNKLEQYIKQNKYFYNKYTSKYGTD